MSTKTLAKSPKALDLGGLLTELAPSWAPFLPAGMKTDAIINGFLAEVSRTPKIAQCSQQSIQLGLLQCARLGLEPSSPLGHVYLIPYDVSGRGLTLTVIVGYKGYLELMRRSGQVRQVVAGVVYEDEMERSLFVASVAPPVIEHAYSTDVDRSPGKLVAAYCAIEMQDAAGGGRYQVILDRKEVEARKARGAGGPAWRTDTAAMWRKSAVRALLGSGIVPLSADDQTRVVAADEAETHAATARGVIIPAEATPVVEAPSAPALAAAPVRSAEAEDGHDRPTKAELLSWGAKKLSGDKWRRLLVEVVGEDWSKGAWTIAQRDILWGELS